MTGTRFGRALGLAAFLAIPTGLAAQQQLPSAQSIVEKYVQAIGGHDAIARQSTRHVTAEVSLPAMGMTMPVESYYARPNRVAVKMSMSGMEMAQGVDGTVAWSNSSMQGARIMDGPEGARALTMANFDNGFDFAKVFPTMETIGERTVDGHACWNVRMATAAGVEVQNCFDKDSGLLIASSSKEQTQSGEMQMERTMSDYKDFGGVKIPTHETLTLGPQQIVTTVKSVTFEPLPDTTFALPAEVKALQH